jgi:hypothetical protein
MPCLLEKQNRMDLNYLAEQRNGTSLSTLPGISKLLAQFLWAPACVTCKPHALPHQRLDHHWSVIPGQVCSTRSLQCARERAHLRIFLSGFMGIIRGRAATCSVCPTPLNTQAPQNYSWEYRHRNLRKKNINKYPQQAAHHQQLGFRLLPLCLLAGAFGTFQPSRCQPCVYTVSL